MHDIDEVKLGHTHTREDFFSFFFFSPKSRSLPLKIKILCTANFGLVNADICSLYASKLANRKSYKIVKKIMCQSVQNDFVWKIPERQIQNGINFVHVIDIITCPPVTINPMHAALYI